MILWLGKKLSSLLLPILIRGLDVCDTNVNEVCSVSIKDTGISIDSEVFPRLFAKFASKSERGGTGLGLYISNSIIEAHGGKIWAENNPTGEKGATFSLAYQPISKYKLIQGIIEVIQYN
jgi:signal transduction histidine kinase